MVDTVRTIAYLTGTEFATNGTGAITAQFTRDLIVTMAAMSGYGATLTTAAAAGSIQSDATQLTTFATSISPVTSGQGVVLMSFANAPLVIQKVINNGANTLAVYPPSGVSVGSTGARVPNQAILVPVGATISVVMTSSTTGELVALVGNSEYIPQRMGITGGYRNVNPPWVNRLKNNADLVDRSAQLTTAAFIAPTGATAANTQPVATVLGNAKPGYLQSVTDPYYGTTITRISGDPGSAIRNVSGEIWGRVCRHHYSTDQAWNCDESMLMIGTNADNSGNGVTLTMTTNGTTASGNPTLHFAAWNAGNAGGGGVYIGAGVSGTNIPGGTTVIGFDSTAGTVTMSANATSTGVANPATITFTDLSTGHNIFIDGQTYVPLFAATPPNGDPRWHPTKPDTMIYADFANPSSLFSYVPATGASTLITAFSSLYKFLQIGGGHGCVSWPPGQEALPIIPFTATRISDSAVVAFSYDLSTGTKSPEVPLFAGATGSWQGADASVSGTYLVTVDSNDMIYVFNRASGSNVGGPYGSGTSGKPSHYDITFDAAGADCVIGVNKIAGADFGRVVKLNVATGAYTFLTPSSPQNYTLHTSAQGYAFPAWGVATSTDKHDSTSYPLYLGEIFSFPLDASQNPVRLCFHNNINTPANYYGETQASISPSGTRIIFHGNWGNPMADCRPIQLYVCDLRAPQVNFAG